MSGPKIKKFENTLIAPTATILEAIRCIDDAALQVALVVDADRKLLGTVTDGDVRRGILAGVRLEDAVTRVMNQKPTTVAAQTSRAEMLAIMDVKKFNQLPIVDEQHRVIGLEWRDHLVQTTVGAAIQDDVWVVLMLGGQGTRLHPLTENTPKPMLDIGDKPLLETIVRTISGHGFRKFFFAVNYKADVIRNYFGNGEKFGVQIEYLLEKERLGTAGALSLLPGKPAGPMLVMNGDILTNSNFAHLVEFHRQNKAHATMCVREYQHQLPYGVVQNSGTRLESFVEKPNQSFFVNAGIYVIDPEALDFVPQGQYFDMPQLFDALAKAGHESAVFPIREYWLDIGRHDDLERAREDYRKVFAV
jgi:dTDP-glucose pyrophosphorylase